MATKDPLAALRDPELAMSWAAMRTILGDVIDAIAGHDCSGLQMIVGGDTPSCRGRVILPTAHFRVESLAQIVHDVGPDWTSEHYAAVFHEVGHLVWNPPEEESSCWDWEKRLDALGEDLTEVEMRLLLELDPLKLVAQCRGFETLYLVQTELQARVFAMRVSELLMSRYPHSMIAKDIGVATWRKVLHETRVIMRCARQEVLAEAFYMLLTNAHAGDLRAIEKSVRSDLSVFRDLLLKEVPTSKRAFKALWEKTLTAIDRRDPALRPFQVREWKSVLWEELEEAGRDWKRLRTFSVKEMAELLQSSVAPPFLIAWKNRDWDRLCSELQIQYPRTGRAANVAVSIATHYESLEQGVEITRKLYQAILKSMPDTNAWYIARDRLRSSR